MKELILERIYSNDATLGELKDEQGRHLCYTLEETWRNNIKGNSCIPEGSYTTASHEGSHFHDVWQILNVKDRSAVLIHTGNTTLDTEGCILVGERMGSSNGMPAVLDSRVAMAALKNFIGRDENGKLNSFKLTIKKKA